MMLMTMQVNLATYFAPVLSYFPFLFILSAFSIEGNNVFNFLYLSGVEKLEELFDEIGDAKKEDSQKPGVFATFVRNPLMAFGK